MSKNINNSENINNSAIQTTASAVEVATVEATPVRICKCCGKALPLTNEFFRQLRNSHGDCFEHRCKKCGREAGTEVKKLSDQPSAKSVTTVTVQVENNEKKRLYKPTLGHWSDKSLFEELRRRGYAGNLTLSKQVSI